MRTPLKVLSIRRFQDMAVAYLLAVIALAHAPSALAADWHVTTNGVPDASGTEAAPWDISSALDGKQNAKAKMRPNRAARRVTGLTDALNMVPRKYAELIHDLSH